AYYRAGRWEEAIEALGASLVLNRGASFGHDVTFIAMAHGQRGDRDEAHALYEAARLWSRKFAPEDQELRRFLSEAADLLGVEDEVTADPTSVTILEIH